MEGDVITTQEIFAFEQTGVDAKGMVKGRFLSRGIRPKFMEKFTAFGIALPADIFNPNRVYEI